MLRRAWLWLRLFAQHDRPVGIGHEVHRGCCHAVTGCSNQKHGDVQDQGTRMTSMGF